MNMFNSALNSVKNAGNAVANTASSAASSVANAASNAATAASNAASAAGDAVYETARDVSDATGLTRLAELATEVGLTSYLSPISMVMASAIPIVGPLVNGYYTATIAAGKAKDEAFLKEHAGRLSPASQELVKKFAEDGRLAATDLTGRTLRETLSDMLKNGTNSQIIDTVLGQIANPTTINQAQDNSCAAAAVQSAIAKGNPGLYAQIGSDLLESGKAHLPNGRAISVSADNMTAIEGLAKANNWTPEQKLNALFQCALMDYANGPGTYNFATDTTTARGAGVFDMLNNPLAFLSQGLSIGQAQMMQDIAGAALVVNPAAFAGVDSKARTTELQGAIRAAKREGQESFLLPINLASGQVHMIEVTGIDRHGNVTFIDPDTGKPKTADRETFDKMVAWNINTTEDIGTGTGGGATTSGTGPRR